MVRNTALWLGVFVVSIYFTVFMTVQVTSSSIREFGIIEKLLYVKHNLF